MTAAIDEVTELVGDPLGVTRADRLAQLAELLVDLGQRAVDVGPVEADLGRLAHQLLGVGERRQRPGDPVEDRRPALLVALDVLPVGDDRPGIVGLDVAEHVRVPADELVVDARRHVGDGEATLLLGDRGVELDLVQQVAELLDQRLVRRLVVGIERLDGVDQLERLLDEVRHERGVRLLTVPRALLAQRAGELVEPHVSRPDR